MSEVISEKENMLRFFRHEKLDHYPDDSALALVLDPGGFPERALHGQNGTDWFGVEWIWGDSELGGHTPNPYQEPIWKEIGDWKSKMVLPDLDAIDWEKAVKIDNLDSIDRDHQVVNVMIVNGPFERLHYHLGFEEALLCLLTDSEEVSSFLDAYMAWRLRLLDKVDQYYNPDVFMFHDDWGAQTNMFFSPDIWREVFKPQIKKAVDHVHQKEKIFQMHSCGCIEAIVPDLVEIGVDCLQSQDDINDTPALKEITKGKLSYHMVPNFQKYEANLEAGLWDEEKLREEARKDFLKNAEGGYYYVLPFSYPSWWLNVYMDEIGKAAKELSF